jgi:glycine/D-amino acid oxidase-like deaminating enzyme
MSDILIIGGGVIGLLTARELAASGAQVTLVEMGGTGRQASWAGGGILSPLYPWRYPGSVTALASWSQRSIPELCTELFEQTGIDPEYNALRPADPGPRGARRRAGLGRGRAGSGVISREAVKPKSRGWR